MLRENYIDLKKDQYRKDVSRFNAYNIFSEFNNRNSNLVCFIIFLSILLIEINHLNFFHASSFTSEGHDRASLSTDKVNLPRKTPPFFIRFTLSSLFSFFFFKFDSISHDLSNLSKSFSRKNSLTSKASTCARENRWRGEGARKLSKRFFGFCAVISESYSADHNVTNSRLDDWHGERDTDGYALIA